MKRKNHLAILIAALLAHPVLPVLSATADEADDALIESIIARSRAAFSGPCGCPDDVDRAGRSCGRRSAFSRAGGASVICYPENVTPGMLAHARKKRSK